LDEDSPVLKREVFMNILGIINNKGDPNVSKKLLQKLETNLMKKEDKKENTNNSNSFDDNIVRFFENKLMLKFRNF
jgi:hypothetical protein